MHIQTVDKVAKMWESIMREDSFRWKLMCTKHWDKNFIGIISLSPYKNPVR